jgi:flavin reductase (DIM6/NTAB) family NADH-FMN oxidoreductase RutF
MKKVPVQKAFDKFKPEHCVFVISVDKEGKPNGMVASWKTRCSWKPEKIAVVLSKQGNTHQLIRESKEFVIAVPNKSLQKEVEFFGSRSGKNIDKFVVTGIKTQKAKFIKTPLLKDATINFECRLDKEVEVADHIMFIGDILASYIDEKKKVLQLIAREKGKLIYKEF